MIGNDHINMAEKIMAELAENERKRPRGYPERIDDETLRGAREHLVWLVETTWDEVGSNLRGIRTPAHVRPVFKAWEKRVEQEVHVVKMLLRSTERTATSQLLNRQRKQQGDLHKGALRTHEWIGKCWESLERFMQIPALELPLAEQNVIRDAINERARTLAHAGEEYLAIQDREQDLDRLVKDGEAYFARVEFVRFCRSNRYRLTPLNVANALAGLPFVGWRRSAKRCQKWPAAGVGGLSYQIFEIIRRIVQASTRRSALITDAENWLRSRRSTESSGISDLQQNWYYLRRSIKAALDDRTSRSQLPSLISQEYWRRKSNPSPVDWAFAEEERIVN